MLGCAPPRSRYGRLRTRCTARRAALARRQRARTLCAAVCGPWPARQRVSATARARGAVSGAVKAGKKQRRRRAAREAPTATLRRSRAMALGLSAEALRAAVAELGGAAAGSTAEARVLRRAPLRFLRRRDARCALRRAAGAARTHATRRAAPQVAATLRRGGHGATFAERLAAQTLPAGFAAGAGGAHPPRVALATLFVAAGAPRRAAPRRVLWRCRSVGSAERSACPPLWRSRGCPRAADDCPFADVADALLPLLQPGPAGDAAAVPTPSTSWSFLRRGSRPAPAARTHAPAPPPAYAYVPGLCPAPPPAAAAARWSPGGGASAAAAAGDDADAALAAWAAGLRAAGSLLLVLPPWAAEAPPGGPGVAEAPAAVPPPLLRCPSCLLALLAARVEGARVAFVMPPRGAAWLERIMLHGGYPALRQSLLRLDAAAAFAGADAASRAFVARHGGFEAVDAAARAAASAALLDAACAALLRGDAAPLTGHRLRAGTGMAVAARHVAEHCAAMGRLQPAERLLRVALASVRAQPGANAPAAPGGDAHELHLGILADLAAVLQAQGQLTEAQKVLRGAVDRARAWRGPKHAFTRAAEAQLEQVQRAAGELCVRHFARIGIAAATRS